MFFYKHIFLGDQARIGLVKIWNETQIMLVICLFKYHGDENWPRAGYTSYTNHWTA